MSRSVERGELQVIADASKTTDGSDPSNFERHGTRAFAVFTFKYRSLADVKTELIIPRHPSPEPLEGQPQESLTADLEPELIIPRTSSRSLPE